MRQAVAAALFFLMHSAAAAIAAPGPATASSVPEPVRIEGYSGDAMEPFLSRDGRTLFFNTRNDPGADTDIHFALRRDDLTFVHQGVLAGTYSPDLDGVPTMSRDGQFCFISPRDYRQTLNTVYCGHFDGSQVSDPRPQVGLKTERLGRLIFDVEISADGSQMIFAEGNFSGGGAPDTADLYLSERGPGGFMRAGDSVPFFAKVNTDALEYAPALSTDGLELFFTRLTGFWIFRQPQIFRATRAATNAPFGDPVRLPIDGFVEGPALSPDGRALYFHKMNSGHFSIWRIRR